MKRSEFVDLVNAIAQEERKNIAKHLTEVYKTSGQPSIDVFVQGFLQAAEVSARTTAKIIENTGLISFDD